MAVGVTHMLRQLLGSANQSMTAARHRSVQAREAGSSRASVTSGSAAGGMGEKIRAMREADRPAEERLSILDRPRAETDALPAHMLAVPRRPWAQRVDEASSRLALVVGDRRFYIAKGTAEDDLFEFYFDSYGSSSGGGPRSVLVSHGARPGWSSGAGGCVAHGIVPDPVTAVRVGEVEAVLANNAYMAAVPSPGGQVVLTTANGEHVVPLPGVLPATDGPTTRPDGRGYIGLVEYAWSGYTKVEIDDLDVASWHGTLPGAFVLSGAAPDVWRVGVVLLEGQRAGQLASADLVVQRDDAGAARSVKFVGRTGFGPHPDPPRLAAALQRLRELRGSFDGPRRSG